MRGRRNASSTAPRLGRDVFARGAPEHIPHINRSAYEANLYDLLSAYANLRQRQAITQVTIEKRQVWSLVEARELLTHLLGDVGEWTVLDQYLLQYVPDPAMRVTAIASAFAASLEPGARGLAANPAGRCFPAHLYAPRLGRPCRECRKD